MAGLHADNEHAHAEERRSIDIDEGRGEHSGPLPASPSARGRNHDQPGLTVAASAAAAAAGTQTAQAKPHPGHDVGADHARAAEAARSSRASAPRALRSCLSSTAGDVPSDAFASVQPPGLPPCPEENSSWLSFTYLLWLNPLFTVGNRRLLEDGDVPRVRDDVSAAVVSKLFRQKWREQLPRWEQEEREKEEAAAQAAATAAAATATDVDGTTAAAAASADTTSGGAQSKPVNLNHSTTEKINYASYRLLYRTLYAMYGRRYWLCGFLKAAYDATNFAQPILLAELVTHIRDTQNDDPSLRPEAWRGYVIATGMLLLCAFGITMTNIFQRVTYCIGLRCRTALITALYRKSFKLSPAARAQMSTGQIGQQQVQQGRVDGWEEGTIERKRSESNNQLTFFLFRILFFPLHFFSLPVFQ